MPNAQPAVTVMRATSASGPEISSDTSVTRPPIANRYIRDRAISPVSGRASATAAAGCSGAVLSPSRSRRGGTIVAFGIDAFTDEGNGPFVQGRTNATAGPI